MNLLPHLLLLFSITDAKETREERQFVAFETYIQAYTRIVLQGENSVEHVNRFADISELVETYSFRCDYG